MRLCRSLHLLLSRFLLRLIMHTKRYTKKGNGVELYCGDKLVANSSCRDANFIISSCSVCDMEVQTIGHSPETDKVQEYKRDKP